jgi:hypothetical protein
MTSPAFGVALVSHGLSRQLILVKNERRSVACAARHGLQDAVEW